MPQNIPNRKNIRLKQYNYSQKGYYFITICTKNKECILSKIENTNKDKNENCRGGVPPPPVKTKIGDYVETAIKYLINKYENIKIDDYVIMPNHIHLIIEISGRGGTLPLHKIIQELKTFTTKKYNEMHNLTCIKLWQRNYYEHIIRNEQEYLKIKEYIINNPCNWQNDKYC